MRTLDAIARILKKEGIERLSAFPTLAQDETRARTAAGFRSGSLNETLAGLRMRKNDA